MFKRIVFQRIRCYRWQENEYALQSIIRTKIDRHFYKLSLRRNRNSKQESFVINDIINDKTF